MSQIRWAESDCDACEDVIWNIKRKALNVEDNFQTLQLEVNN